MSESKSLKVDQFYALLQCKNNSTVGPMTTEHQRTIRASHIAIGTELTSGQTLNTNSRLVAESLQAMGIKNQLHIVVPDTDDLILQSFDFIAPHSDWIFVYGGLGPTTDDFTRNVVSQWAGLPLVLDEAVWLHIQNILSGRGYPVREFQKQQALFPVGAKIMENTKGTAHGFHIQAKSKEIFVLPGPPTEVQSVFENYLKQWITNHSQSSNSLITQIWNTMGLGESEVSFQIENLIKDFDVVVGYRVHLPYVEVKISYLKSQSEVNQSLVQKIQETLSPILVYKSKYPYPDYFKTLFESYNSISLIDEITQDGIMMDLKKWIPQWESKQIAYYNHSSATIFTRFENSAATGSITDPNTVTGHLMFSVTKNQDQTVTVLLNSNKINLRFEVLGSAFSKQPAERKPLFLKELLYKEILARS